MAKDGRKYWWVAPLLTGITILSSVAGAALLRAFSIGTGAANVQNEIKAQADCNNRQEGAIKELAIADKDLAGVDRMLSDAVTELRVEQRGTSEQFKAVEARLGNIEKSQMQMGEKLDRLLERP